MKFSLGVPFYYYMLGRKLFGNGIKYPLYRFAGLPDRFMRKHLYLDFTGHRRSKGVMRAPDRKSTRLNSSHLGISYAVFCLKKKKKTQKHIDNSQTHSNADCKDPETKSKLSKTHRTTCYDDRNQRASSADLEQCTQNTTTHD